MVSATREVALTPTDAPTATLLPSPTPTETLSHVKEGEVLFYSVTGAQQKARENPAWRVNPDKITEIRHDVATYFPPPPFRGLR